MRWCMFPCRDPSTNYHQPLLLRLGRGRGGVAQREPYSDEAERGRGVAGRYTHEERVAEGDVRAQCRADGDGRNVADLRVVVGT